jgi:hypothetical protein
VSYVSDHDFKWKKEAVKPENYKASTKFLYETKFGRREYKLENNDTVKSSTSGFYWMWTQMCVVSKVAT